MASLDHHSIRIILINKKNEVLLMHAKDPSTTRVDGKYNGDFWFLIGGEQEKGETIEQTAIRELYEETGLKESDFELGQVVWKGEFDLVLSGVKKRMKQKFIVAKTNKNRISLAHLTETEKKVIKEVKWFSLGDIKECKEIIYPILLSKYLPDILKGNFPKDLIDIDPGKNP